MGEHQHTIKGGGEYTFGELWCMGAYWDESLTVTVGDASFLHCLYYCVLTLKS